MFNKTETKKSENRKGLISFLSISFILVIAILIMGKWHLETVTLQYTTQVGYNDELQIIHDFTEGMEMRQKFTVPEDFEFISFRFADHDQRVAGKMIIQVCDGNSGELLLYEEYESASIFYPNPVKVSFEQLGGGVAGRAYEVVLQAADTEEVALGVFGYKTDQNAAIVNGEVSEYALSMGVHTDTDLYRNLTVLVITLAIIALLGVVCTTLWFRWKEENIFLLLAIPFGLAMLLMWPGNEVYDELRHYHTVYNYSNVLLGYGEAKNISELQVRSCDIQNEEALANRRGVETQAQNYWYYVQQMWDRPKDTSVINADISRAPIVENGTVIEYLPAILGMSVARVLGLNYFWMMTVTRLAVMASYIAMCYLAIRVIPILKPMIVLVSALPVNLYQASGISYDGFTFATGIIVFSFIMKLWTKGFNRRDWIIFLGSVFVLGTCKGGVYLTLLILLLFIPPVMYQSRKWQKIIIVFGVAAVSMLSSFVPVFIRWFGIGTSGSVIGNDTYVVSNNYHLIFMFKEPIEYLKLLTATLIERMDIYWGQMLGYRTAWSNEPIKMAVMLPFLILLILAVVRDRDDNFTIGIKAKAGVLGILAVEIVGMHALFLGETSIYSEIITGCQGRYFTLFIPLILLLFRHNGLVFEERKEYLYPCYSMAQLVYLYFFLEMFMCA